MATCDRRSADSLRFVCDPASQLGGDFAEQVGCTPGPGMGQWAGIVGQRRRRWRSVRGRPAVSNLPSVKSAPHCGSPGQTGGRRGG